MSSARAARPLHRAAPVLLAAATVLASAAAAAGPFDLKGTQPHDLDATNPPEDTVNKCSSCHAGGTDDNGDLYRPWDSWGGTMMANAMRDPLFLAALTVAEQDAKGVGTFCIRCHTPQAYVRGDAADGLGGLLTDDDKQGVACEACHRSSDPSTSLGGKPPVDPMGPYAGNSQLFWDPGVEKHGPYADADSPAHTTLPDPFTESAKLCGQCHEVSNPVVNLLDAQGNDTGHAFPLDTTFTEWTSSAYSSGASAKTCVECHMPKAKGDLTLSTFPTAMTRTDPRRHAFAGGNIWGIDAVQAADPALAKDRQLSFMSARDAAKAMLESAVKVEITKAPAAVSPADPIDVTVRVENLTGHKFPTGYADGRRAFLRIEILDDQQQPIATIGAYDTAKHDLIPDAQLHVYEAVQEAHDGMGPPVEWHIARNNTIAKDTRIPPKGFIPGPTTPILGASYDDGMGGTRSYDDASVSLSLPASTSGKSLTLRATVLYQSTVSPFVNELIQANTTDNRGQTLGAIYAATGHADPIAIASAEATIALNGASGSGGGGSGGGGTGGGGSGGPDGGCGCSFPGDAGTPAAAPLLVGLWIAARRRRARSRRHASVPWRCAFRSTRRSNPPRSSG